MEKDMNISPDKHPETKTFISRSIEDTYKIASQLIEQLTPSGTLALHGDLGTGKTTFVQGLAVALNINYPITSPTFTIVNEYPGTIPLYHMDLYRLSGPDEILALGFEDYLANEGIVAIEWAERAGDLIPQDTVHIYLKALPAHEERQIKIIPPA